MAVPQSNGVNGSSTTPAPYDANDNITRFTAPSRPKSPSQLNALFHNKSRCFV